jgi:2-(acetamidomethylene)succinate hydrolase
MIEPTGNEALTLAYSDPRGSGTPILFVHGFSHNRSVWEKFMADLPESLRPISIDLRGHGESPWSPHAAYDLYDYARDLPRLLDALSIERAIVVGHSLGGNVATLFGASAPRRLAALVLVDTGPALELGGMTQILDDVGSALRSYASVSEFREQLGRTHPQGDADVLDRLAETGLVERLDGRFEPAFDPGVLRGADRGDVDPRSELATIERTLWTALRGVRCPVLVVRGGLSAILSEKVAQEMVEEALDAGRLVSLPRAGHAVMIDDAPGLREALCGFLDRLA